MIMLLFHKTLSPCIIQQAFEKSYDHMPRIILRPITTQDTENIVKWRNLPAVRQNFIYQQELTPAEHEAWLQNRVLTKQVYQFIIQETETKKDIGSVYLRDVDLVNQKAEFGIFIGETEWHGKGLGTQAAQQILAFAFDELQLHKVFLRVLAHNQAAIASYQKVGFVQEGAFRDDVFLNGKFHEVIFMAMLVSDYKKKKINS